MLESHLRKKLDQGSFFLQELKSVDDDFKREAFFSAYLTALKSVLYYIQTWMRRQKKISNKNEFWPRIRNWAQVNFSVEETEQWDCIITLRNVDIHEEPAVPEENEVYSYWPKNYWPRSYWPKGYWGSSTTLTITHPETKKTYMLFKACEISLNICRRLIDEYHNL